jgi:LCP family protein required for cell wall assembly
LVRGLVVSFFIAASITAVLVFITVRDITAGTLGSSNTDFSPGSGTPNATNRPPTLSAPDVQLEPWDGASRVTILVMGLDYNDWRAGEGPPRTDSMMLLTLDPISRTAGMLSIPRDLWVSIPGFEHARINTAYQNGEAFQLPGRGPGLAVATVEQFLGVKINFYAVIQFDAFVRFIDEIGGVKIDVPEEITVDSETRVNHVTLQPGVQTLPGDIALGYARARKTEGGDFDRAQRQQQLAIAIRDELLSTQTQAYILANGPQLYQDLAGSIQTNMTFDQMVKLGLLALQIDANNIRRGVIAPPEQVILATSPDGQEILKPVTEKIRILRDEIFTAGPASGPVAVADIAQSVAEEGARVAIYNGSGVAGLAGTTQEYLIAQGINVVEVGNSDPVTATRITLYTSKPYTLQFLVNLMQIQSTRIFNSYDPNSAVDIEIIIGPDWIIPAS